MNNIDWQSYKSSIHIDPAWKKRAKASIVFYTKRTSNQTEIIYGYKPRLAAFKVAAAITVFIFFTLTPATIASAKNSRPGHLLYPLKRLSENAQLALAQGESKTTVYVAQTVERTHELSTSVEKDSQDLQMRAVLEVEATKKELEKLPDEIKKETYKKVKERLENIKVKVKHDQVKVRLDAIIEAFGVFDDDKQDEGALTPTPTGAKKSPTPTPSPIKTTSDGAHSEVKVETNSGFTQVIINGEVVVTAASTQDDTKIEVKVNGDSVRIHSSSNVENKSTIDVESDD